MLLYVQNKAKILLMWASRPHVWTCTIITFEEAVKSDRTASIMVSVFLMLFQVPSSGSCESKWWRRGRSEATPTSPVGLYVFYIKHSWVRRACLHWAGCLALAQRRVWRGSAANSCYRESQADGPWRPQEPWTQTQGSAWSSSLTVADRAGHGTVLFF